MNSNILLEMQNTAQSVDRDRYFLSLFAPRQYRPALWALTVFNHEIAKTREVVSETQLGLIRLQWWREEIGKIYEGGAGDSASVLQALKDIIQTYELPKELFETLIYAREFDLEDVLPETLGGTVTYVQNTSAPLIQLSAKIIRADEQNAQTVAMNYALIGMLRAVPFHAMQSRCYLPQNMLTDQGINPYALFKGKETEKLPEIIEAVLKEFTIVKPQSRYLKAVQSFAKLYKKHIERHDYNVFKMANYPPPALKELRVSAAVYLA